MMWFSGLRGAMAFALAVQNTVSPARSMFFTTTCIMAITTVIVVGSLTTPALSLLQVTTRQESLLVHGNKQDFIHCRFLSGSSKKSTRNYLPLMKATIPRTNLRMEQPNHIR